jgi:hypothetical protein
MIAASLNDFFSSRHRDSADKCRLKFNRGIILGVTGTIIMILNAAIGFKESHTFPLVAIRVILEPAR